VTVDEISGEITSLYDKVNGREVVDNTGGMGFNRLVRADQDAAVVWGTWEDAPAGPLQITSESGPVLSRLIITRAESPLSQTIITLPAGLPRVEIQNTLDHDRTQYADHLVHTYWYYVTMPFALGATGFSGRFQGPNGWLIPQQDWLPGAAHNARVSQQGVGVRDAAGFGVTLANRESYLSSFGSTGFWDATEPERPVLFLNLFARSDEALTADQGWLAFDTWEPGAPRQYTFNFALTSTDSGFDPVAAGTFSAGYNRPLLVAGIARRADGPLPGPTGSLLTVSHDNVAVVTLKRADFENPDGGDLILRLQEIDGQAAEGVTITLPFALDWAEVNGLGEQRADGVPLPVEPLTVSLAPYQTLTVRLRPIWSGD
ncbi:MAG: glycosyl hydrolase-related protein, partial [Chloroflexota bacterium]